MESQAKYLFVGLSLIIMVLLLLGAVLWIQKDEYRAEGERYLIFFSDHSLSGLQVGSIVTMRGIKVGAVSDFRFLEGDPAKVKVLVELQPDTPVKISTRATVQRNLLTGVANIELGGGQKEAHPLDFSPPGEPYPVIREGEVGLQAIKENLPQLLDRTSSALTRITAFFSEENLEAVTTILANTKTFTNELLAAERPPSEIIAELTTIIVEGRKFLETATQTTEKLKQVAVGASESVTQGVGEITTDVGRAASSVAAAAEKISEPRSAIFGPPSEALGPGEAR